MRPSPASLNPFFSTAEQRASLARERFFEEGVRPAGLVSDAVLQSWSRCAAAGQRTQDRLAPEPVSRLRLESALRSSRQLRDAASVGMRRLETALAGTANRVILTNAHGIIIRTGQQVPLAHEQALGRFAQVGIDLSESNLGTTAPGIVAITRTGCTVMANEHFNEKILRVQCAAAPIHDVEGRLAGVLDLSVESGGTGFGFDAFTLISSYASDIENALLQKQSKDLLVLAFHAEPTLIDTPLTALAGIDADGQTSWINRVGTHLAGGRRGDAAESVFGRPLSGLLSLLRHDEPAPLRLPNGLTLWFKARLTASNGLDGPVHPSLAIVATCATPALAAPLQPAPGCAPDGVPARQNDETATPSKRLDESQADNISRALRTTSGNVARAARLLGVSRGVIYRHLRRYPEATEPC